MPFPRSLRARLLLAFLVVAAATLGTVAVAALLVGPGYFAEAMGHLPGDPMGEAMGLATQAAFEQAMQRALVAATVIAIVSATVVSLAVAARIAGPIGALVGAARRIAGGHYAERVPVSAPDELGELADSFNEMAGSLEATERRRLQLVELVRFCDRHPFRVMATRDSPRSGRERPDRPRDPRRDGEAHHGGADDGDDGRRHEGALHRLLECRLRRGAHRFPHRVAREVPHRLREVAGAYEQRGHGDGAEGRPGHQQEGEQQASAERARERHQPASRRR